MQFFLALNSIFSCLIQNPGISDFQILKGIEVKDQFQDTITCGSFNSYPFQGIHISEKGAGFFVSFLDHQSWENTDFSFLGRIVFNLRAVSSASRAVPSQYLLDWTVHGLFRGEKDNNNSHYLVHCAMPHTLYLPNNLSFSLCNLHFCRLKMKL